VKPSYSHRKQIEKKNKEAQYLVNSILKDEIKKKSVYERKKKTNNINLS
jgi:hypothetical protein